MKGKFRVSMSGQVLNIRLIGEINWWKNSGEEFTAEIDRAMASGIRDLNLYIKSDGGDPLEALEVYKQIKRMPGMKTAYLGTICASSATVPACACDKVVMTAYGFYMVHEPEVYPHKSMTEDELQAAVGLLQTIKSNVTAMYVKRTGKTEEEVKQIMKSVTWMTSAQALENNWIDAIGDGNEMDSEMIELDSEMLSKIPVQMKSNLIPVNKMLKPKLMAALMLAGMQIDVEATDEAYVQMVGKLVKDYNDLKDKLEKAETATMKAKAKMLVDNAIEQKKIVEGDREEYTQLAESNFDLATKMLAKIAPVMQITDKTKPDANGNAADMKGKKFSERMTADPQAMMKMREDNWSEYARLYKEEYGSEPDQY